MNHRNSISNFILLLAAGLLCLNAALAAPPTKVTVTNADPNSALQGDALDVVISGTGFDVGSKVKFLVTGTKDNTQINVGIVVLNPDGTLTASIQVLGTASAIDYDIEVRASSGRRGKGTTLFKVSQNGDAEDPSPHRYNVTFAGDLTGGGEDWGESSKTVQYSRDFGFTGTGELNLDYFRAPFPDGPFTGSRGVDCFGAIGTFVSLYGATLQNVKGGSAKAMIQFEAYAEDGFTPVVVYDLFIYGLFDGDPDDWPPSVWNSMTLTA